MVPSPFLFTATRTSHISLASHSLLKSSLQPAASFNLYLTEQRSTAGSGNKPRHGQTLTKENGK